MDKSEKISKALGRMAKDARDLVGTDVVRLSGPPTPLEFMRVVAANRPVVFQRMYVPLNNLSGQARSSLAHVRICI